MRRWRGPCYEEYRGGLRGAASAGLGLLDRVTGENLTEIRNTYEEHGGGLKGVAAVAMTGIRDRYEQGFTDLDTLTGGRLTALKDIEAVGVEHESSIGIGSSVIGQAADHVYAPEQYLVLPFLTKIFGNAIIYS